VPQNVSDAIDKALQLRYKQRTQDMIGFICDLTNDTTVPPLPKNKPDSGMLSVYYGNRVAATFELTDGVDYVVGRSSQTCNILVKSDMRVSRSHCRIRYNASRGTVTVTDLSTYGTFLIEGGQYLKKGVPIEFATDITLQLSSSDVFLGIRR
jgi:pSer/pThr/pTyr-binding forkhead associated (FHA) protein